MLEHRLRDDAALVRRFLGERHLEIRERDSTVDAVDQIEHQAEPFAESAHHRERQGAHHQRNRCDGEVLDLMSHAAPGARTARRRSASHGANAGSMATSSGNRDESADARPRRTHVFFGRQDHLCARRSRRSRDLFDLLLRIMMMIAERPPPGQLPAGLFEIAEEALRASRCPQTRTPVDRARAGQAARKCESGFDRTCSSRQGRHYAMSASTSSASAADAASSGSRSRPNGSVRVPSDASGATSRSTSRIRSKC